MRIKLLKDLPDYKAGHVFEEDDDADQLMVFNHNAYIYYDYTKYPDFFQVIDEDEELVKEISNKLFISPIKHTDERMNVISWTISYLREKGKLK